MFGDGRPQVGALLLPSASGAELSRDRSAYLAAVWPVIAAANARAPSHSRLLPEMVEILPPGTDVPVATKMSILRPACYRQFAPIIDSVYQRFESADSAEKRRIDDQDEMEGYLLELLGRTLGDRGQGIERDTDLFAFGVDSLMATRVRNTVQKEVELAAPLGQNVVYEYPSVVKLAQHILSASSSGAANGASVHDEMEAMAAKWAARVVPPVPGTKLTPSDPVILVTGATGSLGAHTVAALLCRPNVRVICLSRARSDADSLSRLEQSFAARRLRPDWDRIESYASDLSLPDLGLGFSLAHVRESITAVLHLAWPVNFAAALGSLEPSVSGAVNLLNLAQSSPLQAKPGFFFASSVGAVQSSSPDASIEERFSSDPEEAGGTGYARSKWVVEAIVERTRGTVLRIGQLVGDSTHGVWNETEAWPLMFRSAAAVGALPDLEERVGWMPVDLAAEAIAEVALSPPSPASASSPTSATEPRVLHILNRHLTPFTSILSGLRRAGVQFDTVPRSEWLSRLAESDPDVARNPTRKLLPFYEARIGGEEEKTRAEFDTARAEEACPSMRRLEAVDEELVAKWVDVWRESGFFPGH